MRTTIKVGAVLLAVALIAAGVISRRARSSRSETASFRTAQVTRGELLVTISATGTLEPEETVDVGTQVSGQIMSLGNDAAGKTVGAASSLKLKGGLLKKAAVVGEEIAKIAKEKKVKQAVFDRGGYPYQGAVKALAEAARQEGLEI